MSAPEWAADLASRRAELLRRLRSGEYRQGLGRLRSSSGEFCCLGVIADMGVEAGVATWRLEDFWEEGPVVEDMSGNTDANYLSPDLVDWIGLNSFHGRLDIDAERNVVSLAEANDAGYTFEQIADLIEAGRAWKENR